MRIRPDRSLYGVGIAIAEIVLVMGVAGVSFAGTETITKEAKETLEATKQYTIEQKEAFQRKAHEELAVVQKQIGALRGKGREVSAATRAELQKSIDELETKKDAAKRELEQLKAVTDSKWSAMKANVSSALEDLKSSYQKAASRLP
jgi:peptidoglycan hydrolase CwlO-like protein